MATITLPHGFTLRQHQREVLAARDAGARWMIARHHRQSGKGILALALTVRELYEHGGTIAIISPTQAMADRNFMKALTADGTPYLSAIPDALLVGTHLVDMEVTMRTRTPGRLGKILFLSADDPSRARGPAIKGVIIDEYAHMDSDAVYLTVRPSLEIHGGWCLITSTPRGKNHFHDLWMAAQNSPNWWTSTKTIDDTGLLSRAQVETWIAEGADPAWCAQEFDCRFETVGMRGAYFADQLARAEQEGRIGEYPYRPERKVMTGWDLGISDTNVIVYVQEAGEYLHVINAEGFEGLALPEIIARMHQHGYVFEQHWAPHDIEVRDYSVGRTRRDVAAGLGVRFKVAPRMPLPEGIDNVRRLFFRLRFDARACARLLEALSEYGKVWDEKGKTFRDRPAHTWASHWADALRTLATGWRSAAAREARMQRAGPPLTARHEFDPTAY